MLAFPSNSSRNKNGSDPKNGKTTPIHDIMGITYIVQFSDSNDSNDVLPLFLLWLNHFYKIQFSSSSWMEVTWCFQPWDKQMSAVTRAASQQLLIPAAYLRSFCVSNSGAEGGTGHAVAWRRVGRRQGYHSTHRGRGRYWRQRAEASIRVQHHRGQSTKVWRFSPGVQPNHHNQREVSTVSRLYISSCLVVDPTCLTEIKLTWTHPSLEFVLQVSASLWSYWCGGTSYTQPSLLPTCSSMCRKST